MMLGVAVRKCDVIDAQGFGANFESGTVAISRRSGQGLLPTPSSGGQGLFFAFFWLGRDENNAKV